MKIIPFWFYQQAGAIPYRRIGTDVEILLITSKAGHWIIPKGLIDPGETPMESACKEAHEEAGVEGHADPQSVGQYQYNKLGATCRVQVFALEVTRVFDSWPEAGERQRQWFVNQEAVNAIRHRALKEIIHDFTSKRS